jgi:hypothetical protein
MDTKPATPDLPNPDPEKSKLECEKLRAEIEVIRNPVHKSAAFYAAISPVALAILGLIFTWATGWFDVQRTRVSNDKTLVEAQTERLKMERTILEGQAREQQAKMSRTMQDVESLKQRESALTNQVANLERERDELRTAKELLLVETKRLASSDTKAAEFLQKLRTIQADREQMSSNILLLQASNFSLRATGEKQTALIRWAIDVASEGWDIALKDKATWKQFQPFGQHVFSLWTCSFNYLPEWQVDPDPVAPIDERASKISEDEWHLLQGRLAAAMYKTHEDRVRESEARFRLLEGNERTDDTGNQSNITPAVK